MDLIVIIVIQNETFQINLVNKPLAHFTVINAKPSTLWEVNWKLRYLRRPDSRYSELIYNSAR